MNQAPKVKKKRLYQPIWESVRDKGFCNITAPQAVHRRIIKAVIKEKDKDAAFHVEAAEKWSWTRLDYKIEGSMIKFILKHPISHEDL